MPNSFDIFWNIEKRDIRPWRLTIRYIKDYLPFCCKMTGIFIFTVLPGRTGRGDGFLIMMALGMDEKDAVKEYLLSNQYLKQGFPRRVQIPVSLQFIPVPRIRSASRTFWGISFMA